MAIIRTLKISGFALLIEDPTPGSNKIYGPWYDAYDKTTFNYIFDTVLMNTTSVGTQITGIGASGTNSSSYFGDSLILKGESTTVGASAGNNGVWQNILDEAPFASMDPSTPIYGANYYTDGTNNCGLLTYKFDSTGINNSQTYQYKKVNYSGDFSTGLMNASYSTVGSYNGYPLYRDPTTNQIVGVGIQSQSTKYTPSTCPAVNIGSTAFSTSVSAVTVGGGNVQTIGTSTGQFIGKSQVTGWPLYLTNLMANDYTQTIYQYNISAGTTGSLYAFNTAPTTGGTGITSAGGARLANATVAGGGLPCPKYASKTFPDPANPSTRKGFYVPFLDTNGNYHPMYFTWTLSNDTFTRNAVTTLCNSFSTPTTAWTQGNYWTADLTTQTSVSYMYGLQRAWANEVFTVSGTNYLIWMQLHGAGGQYDSTASLRTFVVFQIAANDGTSLAYHSSFTIPFTPKNIVWLNDARTLLGVFTNTYFYIYSFNAVSGFVLTNTQPYNFRQVGRDSTGRIWAVDTGTYNAGRLHLLNGAAPANVTVVPAANAYTYSGTNINTTVTVNAYDLTNSRVATTLILTSSGSPLYFLDGSNNQVTSITVTTSASADVTVNAVVTASGSSTITATLSI